MTITLDLIGIATSDMAASLAFYRHLGLDIPPEADDRPHVEVTLPGGLRVAWDTDDVIRGMDPGFSPAPGAGRVSLAFLCGTPAGVDATYRSLIEAGHEGHLEPWDAVWGQRYAVVHDPDGNGVDLFAPLEVSGGAH
jgi:catechol 2,3-dioxygenase-like lactoylglutathione lyase family enzyme